MPDNPICQPTSTISRARRWLREATGVQAIVLVVALLVGSARAETAAPETATKKFNVPSDVAERSLKVFSQQSGREVLFATDTVGGIKTNSVQGEYTPQEAAKKLLLGTGLIAVPSVQSGAYTIGRAPDPNGHRASPPRASDRPKTPSPPPTKSLPSK